jgi:hypothetical protein
MRSILFSLKSGLNQRPGVPGLSWDSPDERHQGPAGPWTTEFFHCHRWRSFALGLDVHCVFSSVVSWFHRRCVTFCFKYIYRNNLSKMRFASRRNHKSPERLSERFTQTQISGAKRQDLKRGGPGVSPGALSTISPEKWCPRRAGCPCSRRKKVASPWT